MISCRHPPSRPCPAGLLQILFEGIPTYPHDGRWWELVDKHQVRGRQRADACPVLRAPAAPSPATKEWCSSRRHLRGDPSTRMLSLLHTLRPGASALCRVEQQCSWAALACRARTNQRCPALVSWPAWAVLQVTVFYTAPTAIRTLMARGDSNVTRFK